MTKTEPAADGVGLLISAAARLVGVTPRAVRHYHAAGLVPEPARDSSGYRRYGSAELVQLVRIARLRALGMPVAQIADRLSAPDPAGLSDDLRALARGLDDEIIRLAALRDRLNEAAASATFVDAPAMLAAALVDAGALDSATPLPSHEAEAAQLVDALHPHGMAAVLDDAHELIADADARRTLSALLERYRTLTDSSSNAEVDALAAEVAAVLPRPEQPAAAISVDTMDGLLRNCLNGGQRRFMRHLRERADRTDA